MLVAMSPLIALFLACPAGDDSADHDSGSLLGECRVDAMELGLTHRAEATACDPRRAPLDAVDPSCGTRSDDTCTDHADCTEFPGGRCRYVAGEAYCGCSYDECQVDDDCAGSSACACGEVGTGRDTPNNRCVRAECRLDSDCASGLCLASVGADSCTPPSAYIEAFTCATEADTCRNDEACSACFATDARCRSDDSAFACAEIGQATCE